MTNAESPDPIPVTPDTELGSARLAAALADGDADAIGQALRLDVVLIPLLTATSGERQIRLFQTLPNSSLGYELALFSSLTALIAFLADDPNREFDVRGGSALAPFLRENSTRITRVLFDPAGPHPIAAPVDAVLAALEPNDDDLVEWVSPT